MVTRALEDAMYRHLHGQDCEVEDVTAHYLTTEEMEQEVKLVQLGKAVIDQACQENCQVSCQSHMQLQPSQQQPIGRRKEVELPIPIPNVKEEDKVICAECKYYYINPNEDYGMYTKYRCTVARTRKRNPLTGEYEIQGEISCDTLNRNKYGNCPKFEEIPDCDLAFNKIDRHLYKLRLLKVYWDGDDAKWVKKFGLRRD